MTEAQARVKIRKVGRWTYQLALYPAGGWIGLEGPTVIGRRRAERRARRDLRRHLRRFEAEVVSTVTP